MELEADEEEVEEPVVVEDSTECARRFLTRPACCGAKSFSVNVLEAALAPGNGDGIGLGAPELVRDDGE
jgi:hypothetical protein